MVRRKKLSKSDLFLQLANPDANGKSDWIETSLFTGEYEDLKFGNGADFIRKGSVLEKKYIIEVDKNKTPGNRVDAIRLNGFKTERTFSQYIRKDIVEKVSQQRCVMLGVRGTSINTKIEVDHKDGRKDDWRVSDPSTQKESDFQPLCKAANDIKRQICKQCKNDNKRWDAKNILGNPYSFYEGDAEYQGTCVGCYQYDPVQYRKSCVLKISEETRDFILNKFYPDDENKREEAKKKLK